MARRHAGTIGALAAITGVLLALPMFVSSTFTFHLIITANIAALFALSWDFLAGFIGQISFGQALFFGTAAYGTALLNATGIVPTPWLSCLLGIGAAVAVGALVGIPTLRLKGPYLSLITLAASQIGFVLANTLNQITGGEEGVRGIRPLVVGTVANYRLSLVLLFVVLALLYGLTQSRVGLILRAIKGNQASAEAVGINPVLYKTLGYCLSAALAGLAGACQAHYLGIVTPDSLSLSLAFSGITSVVIGGLGTLFGPVLAVYAVTFFLTKLQAFSDYRLFIYSVALILILLFLPDGLYPGVRGLMQWRRRWPASRREAPTS